MLRGKVTLNKLILQLRQHTKYKAMSEIDLNKILNNFKSYGEETAMIDALKNTVKTIVRMD